MQKNLFYRISSAIPFSLLLKLSSLNYVAPFYHIISGSKPLHVKHLYPVISPEIFFKDLSYLLKHFEPVCINDLPLVYSKDNSAQKPFLFLSFDDGFKELASEIAPMLLQLGVPATFFVNPNFVDNKDMLFRCKLSLIAENVLEHQNDKVNLPDSLVFKWGFKSCSRKVFIKKLFDLKYADTDLIEAIAQAFNVDWRQYLQQYKPYLTLQQLNDLASKGFAIGAHSMSHPLFSDITIQQQIEEVENSLSWIEKNIPNQPRAFAFPFTDFGVQKEFYKYFFETNSESFFMMFGTAGIKPTNSVKFINRIPMEISDFSAKQVVGGQMLNYLGKKIFGMHKMILPV